MPAHQRQALTGYLEELAGQVNRTAHDVTRVSSNQAVACNLVLVDAAAADVQLTLPAAVRWMDEIIRIKKMDSSGNRAKIVTTNSETIDGTLTVALAVQYTCVQLMSDGAQWVIV